MNPQESLDLIQSMISEAKNSYYRTSPFFLIWGSVFFLSGISEYVIVYEMGHLWGYACWGFYSAIGGIISAIYSRRESQNKRTTSHYDRLSQFLWASFGVTLFLVIAGSVLNQYNPTPYVLAITGIPTFVSGAMINFQPLKTGGIVFWISAAIVFFIPVQYSGLVFSAAIALGYLYPGYVLFKKEK